MKTDPTEWHPEMDYQEHTNSYKLFVRASIYMLLGVVVLMAALAFFVA